MPLMIQWRLTKRPVNTDAVTRFVDELVNWLFNKILLMPSMLQRKQRHIKIEAGILGNGSTFTAVPGPIKSSISEIGGLDQALSSSPTTTRSMSA
jgi:hypothetical protein